MYTQLAILVSLICLFQANPAQSSGGKRQTSNAQAYNRLKSYVGKYPKQTRFFSEPLVKSELKRILGKDYQQYRQHVAVSGCGAFVLKGNLLYADVSQMHVGGYDSLIFIDLAEKRFYMFWLKGTVADKEYEIYGDKPIPETILKRIVEEMNLSWGHVAEFGLKGNTITINIKH